MEAPTYSVKTFFYILTTISLFLIFGGNASAQTAAGGQDMYVDASLEVKGYEFRGEYVVITYEIPYSGIVEIRLFDDKDQQVWQNQYTDKWGENTIVLRRSAFNEGHTYGYVINYKRDEVRDKMVIPAHSYE